MTFLMGGLLAIIVLAYSFMNWRQALMGVLLLVVFEGALRKWVLPQASDYVYFLKDLMLIAIYVRAFAPQYNPANRTSIPQVLGVLLTFNAIWALVGIFNPRLGSPIVGLLGVRAYFYYIPLMWLIPRLFADQAALIRFLRGYLLLTIPIGILGIVQYFSPASSQINVYVGGLEANAMVGSNVRITGVFSYIAGYATYLTITFALLLPFLFTRQPRFWGGITLVELALIVGNSLMTGSRGVLVAQALILIGFVIVYGLTRPSSLLLILTRLAIPGLVVAASLAYFFEQAMDNFVLRTMTSDSVSARIVESFTQPFSFVYYTGLSGYGIGATLPGGQTLAQQLGLRAGEFIPIYFESEMGRVMLEVGPAGFLLWYGLRFCLLALQWRTFRQLQTPILRHLALVALLINATQFSGSLIVNPTFIVYYWFLNSFILLLPRLEHTVSSEKAVPEKPIYGVKTTFSRPSYRQS